MAPSSLPRPGAFQAPLIVTTRPFQRPSLHIPPPKQCRIQRSHIRIRMCQPVSTNPSPVPSPSSPTTPSSPILPLTERAIQLASTWSTATSTGLAAHLAGRPSAVAFFMVFVDRVMRAQSTSTAARLLHALTSTHPIPTAILSQLDAFLLTVGAAVGIWLPQLVIPLARSRMRQIVHAFIADLAHLRFDGLVGRNVNILGEAVLGDAEAARRLQQSVDLLRTPGLDYVSVKISGIVSQLNPWDFDGSLQRILHALRILFREAVASRPRVLINLDMEEYRDLELTIAAFTTLLSEPEFHDLDAGIVLQTYLPDALPALKKLVSWAHTRPGNAEIKIRLVKGANLAMEKVDAVMHGWKQAPYLDKVDTDANFLRCLSWVLTKSRTERVRIGVASHNLFFLAYARLLAERRRVKNRVGFEMLQGMTPSHTPILAKQGHGMLLYTPVCATKDFDVAISYLFRRFEETTADGNFLRSLPAMKPGSPAFAREEMRFRDAVMRMDHASTGPRREQKRPAHGCAMSGKALNGKRSFQNEPDTDPTLPSSRKWGQELLTSTNFISVSPTSRIEATNDLDDIFRRAEAAVPEWSEDKFLPRREALFLSIADELARRRGDLINAMIHEGKKTIGEADSEVSEAIDFASYYGSMIKQLPKSFKELGVMCVTSPWNFPVAIPCGGALAALAAGNAVILKPSSLTPRCAEIVAECLWAAGVPRDVFHFVQSPSRDIGRDLVTRANGVILTGSSETAALFKSWKNDMRLFAETSGKNVLIISEAADIDLAVADLVKSSFSNSGQRCSASSLAICVGDVYHSARFRRQLEDAVKSIKVGQATDISTIMGPLIRQPDEKLKRALTDLDEGETWLVEPHCMNGDQSGDLWAPGVRLGVKPGSWFHQTEVFGPVLGIMHAKNIDEALAMQNGTGYGLTGGIHTLDPVEIEYWSERVEVGNAYVNRPITGAIVQRQSFGGWKRSVVGPGAKAGGPNYIFQFGVVNDTNEVAKDEKWLSHAIASDEKAWRTHFSQEQDPSSLFCEQNILRYTPLPEIAVRISSSAHPIAARRVRASLDRCGVEHILWSEGESSKDFIHRLKSSTVSRIRVVGEVESDILEFAAESNIHVASDDVVLDGRFELMHYLREQAISRTLHRFGNMIGS